MSVIALWMKRLHYTVGVSGVTMIRPTKTDDGTLWYDVYKGEDIWARVNAKAIEVIRYGKKTEPAEPLPEYSDELPF